jgi:DNA helicase-2/ATP-dependent DNA helicase PcrA
VSQCSAVGELAGRGLSTESRFHTGPAKWLVASSKADLDGEVSFEKLVVLEWSQLRERWIEKARNPDQERTSLRSAAHEWFEWLDRVDRLAVVGVQLESPRAADDLLAFVVEPAAKLGIELIIGADRRTDQLDRDAFVEPEFGYAYSLERLLWCVDGVQPGSTTTRTLAPMEFVPDRAQQEAVDARSGAVQIIAPAGSGKTAVLVERIRELLRRGASPGRILAVTFNVGAREELESRLEPADAAGVQVANFHRLGRRVLVDAREIRSDSKPWSPSVNQWRRLAVQTKNAAGVWFDPPDAKSALSDIKLGNLLTAPDYTASLTDESDDRERALAVLYTAYEEMKQSVDGRIDFDDMIMRAVLLLRSNPTVRTRWQHEFEYILVDEYQDIEPAQELLVRIIAAPHDQLFAVGDEDQTLYAFRRASVQRIIDFDLLYPGVQRVALKVNYRCRRDVVLASSTLIKHNKVRFTKDILPFHEGDAGDSISLRPFSTRDSGVTAAQTLKECQRGDVVVLARTTDALRPAALACADFGVRIDGPEKLFKPTGARLALEDHLRLAFDPHQADAELIARVCRTPARHASTDDMQCALETLQAGGSFETAFEDVAAPNRGKGKLWPPGNLFTAVAECADAAEAIALLRTIGGLDEWFQDAEGTGGRDVFECEVLEHAQRDAAGMSPEAYLDRLRAQRQALEEIRDPKNGIEFRTIHGAKGRQWPHVILLACEQDVLPHKRSLVVTQEERERGEGMEAERRLGYVAFTRAEQRLEIHYDGERPSPFLTEAGLLEAPAKRAAREPPPPPGISEAGSPKRPAQGGSLRAILKRLVDPGSE